MTMRYCFFGSVYVILVVIKSVNSQHENSALEDQLQCNCMEYWDCVGEGGTPYSYCAYTHKVCCFIDVGSQKIGILPKRTKHSSCGEKGVDSGKDGVSEPGEWAWHAAILERSLSLYVCGGSLLDEYWVLTAAHCVDDYGNPRVLKVRLGEHDVSRLDEPYPHEEFDVSTIILHPQFDNETLENDVALVRIRPRARRRPNVNIICIPSSEAHETQLMATSPCYITGWGRRGENANHSVVLKEVNVPIWRQERCEAALQLQFGTEYILPPTSICAGAVGRDACDGDGGGPLVCEDRSRWYQVGVISFGIGCGRRNVPGVYTRVFSYSSWIHDTVLSFRT